MTDQEFEDVLKKSLKINSNPDRASFAHLLSLLEDIPVTEKENLRYNTQTTTSNITNNLISEITSIWKSKRLVLVSCFLVLLFVGAFTLSSHTANHDISIEQLAIQSETIEESEIDNDDPVTLTSFDEPDVSDLDTTQNEL